ncbi:MAG: 3(2),5-bisphosphate nucleotidase CysQ [Pseudomonadota bacterium]
MVELPKALADSPCAQRLQAAVEAVASAGAALLSLRGAQVRALEVGSQLKTSVDQAAEGWVLGLLRGTFPDDRFLAEESFAETGSWIPGAEPFWTVDALDGTRSYVEGFPGFCVQVAFVQGGQPLFGAIAEPVAGRFYVAGAGLGAYELDTQGGARRLAPRRGTTWPAAPRFVDSTRPGGRVGQLFAERGGRFVECGSIGLKACRVVTDEADVYAKAFRFRLWDVAPAEVLLRETACGLRLWSGQAIDYSGRSIEFENLVAAPEPLLQPLLERLARP